MRNSQEIKRIITEQDILKKHHKFLRQSDSQDSDQQQNKPDKRSARKNKKTNNVYQQYGQMMAKKYYSKLFKQYALIDLSRFETGQIGCRWRTQKQVIAQKGEKVCGSVECKNKAVQVYQMNFGYLQQGVKKNALVKVSVCNECGKKLNYKKMHKRIINQDIVHVKLETYEKNQQRSIDLQTEKLRQRERQRKNQEQHKKRRDQQKQQQKYKEKRKQKQQIRQSQNQQKHKNKS